MSFNHLILFHTLLLSFNHNLLYTLGTPYFHRVLLCSLQETGEMPASINEEENTHRYFLIYYVICIYVYVF
jgi:hypothetical protein